MPDYWIANDPGVVSGLMVWDGKNSWAQEGLAYEMVRLVESELAAASQWQDWNLHVIVEGVTLPRMSHSPAKDGFGQIESIGTLCYLAQKYGAELLPQDPSMRKGITLAMLQKIGWYYPSPDKHMVDSAKHLVVALLRKRILRIEELI